MESVSRRRFLEESLLASTAALGAAPVLGAARAPRGPNEQVQAAATGVRGRGLTLGLELIQFGARVTHVCDADTALGMRAVKEIAARQGYEPKFDPLEHGFDHFFGPLGGGVDYYFHTEWDGAPMLFEDQKPVRREGYMTDLITEGAERFVREHSGGGPFF